MVEYSGWLYTDAIRLCVCPRCKAALGEYCRSPGGRKANTPHGERMGVLYKEHPKAKGYATRPTIRPFSAMKAIR